MCTSFLPLYEDGGSQKKGAGGSYLLNSRLVKGVGYLTAPITKGLDKKYGRNGVTDREVHLLSFSRFSGFY